MKEKELLKNNFLFKDCPEAIEFIDDRMIRSYSKNDIVYNESDFIKAIGIVVEGTLAVKPLNDSEVILNTLKRSDSFGVASVFSKGDTYVTIIEALTDAKVLFIDESELIDLFERFPKLTYSYISFLSDRIRFLNMKIKLLSSDSVKQKVYEYISRNVDEDMVLKENIKMTFISHQLGIGRTSLYRALNDLEEDHLIIKDNGRITLL